MAEIVYPDDHDRVIRERDEARDAAMTAVMNIGRDRDEWKQQHENLLAIHRDTSKRLADLIAGLTALPRYSISQGIVICADPESLLKAADVDRLVRKARGIK